LDEELRTRVEFDNLLRKLIPMLQEFEERNGIIGVVIVDPPWNKPDMPGTEYVWNGTHFTENPKPATGN